MAIIKKKITQESFGRAWEAYGGDSAGLRKMSEECRCMAVYATFTGTQYAEMQFADEAAYLVFVLKWGS